MRRDAASIVVNWPLWKQQIRLTKYSPEVDFGENKIMSVTAQEAFDKYYGQFDPDGPEWQDRNTQQIFIDGFNIANAQLSALKEENDRLKERSNLLDRRVAALVEIIQECGCDDAEEPANEG